MGTGNRWRQLPATAPGRLQQITEQPDLGLQRLSKGQEMGDLPVGAEGLECRL